MWALGITLNTASVFGLVLVSGLIVDDAIVVLENVYRHMQSGVRPHEAIVRGVGEVIGPVSAAAVTTVMAFLPILLVREGIMSLFTVVPKVVAVALLASLFECLFILPGHILHWGPRGRSRAADRGPSVLSRVGGWLSRAYLGGLASLLRLRYLTALVLVAFLVLAVTAVRLIPVKVLPAEFPMARVDFESHHTASLEDTDRLGANLCAVLDEISGDKGVIENYITVAGMQFTEHQELIRESNVGMIFVQFHPTETARRDPEEVLAQLRDRIEAFRRGNPESGLAAFSISAMGIGVEQTPAIAVRVSHSDMGVCRQVARRIGRRLAEFPGVSQVRDNMREGPLELNLRPDEPQCSEFGLTSYDVAGFARAATEGVRGGNLRDARSGEEVPIRVLFDEPYRDGLDDLLAIPLKTPTGAEPRLEEVATAYYDQHYASLYHYKGRRLITVSATIEGAPTDAEGRPVDVRYVNRKLAEEFPALEREYPGLRLTLGGGYAEQRGAFGDLAVAGVLAAALIYVALLAQFRSYLQPFLVLLTLIFGFIGVVVGLGVHGYAFSVVTAVSLVGLFGVAVNDAILLIDFMNKAPREGDGRFGQALEGCRLRLRPILVTTITTVAGLFPMALGMFGYSAIWSPFAACFCYGLTAATVLTLLLMPCFYLICDDVGRLWTRLWSRLWPKAA
jgi:HAE1 family hydrophobic/amphiphilic exporter-1